MSFSEWKKVEFQELYAEPSKNGLTKPKKVRGQGIKFVNMGELFSYDRIGEQSMDLVPVTMKERENFLLKEDDLLFARQSLVREGAGKCSIILKHKEDMTYDSHLIRVRLNKNIADPKFFYYFFNAPQGKNAISTIVEQVAAAGIRGTDLAKLKVPLPSYLEQKGIVATLSALDDMIELNNQINKTLEEMAQAMFKSWFVDFEPFKDGEFEESELGLIPKGWKVKKIGDVCKCVLGGTPSRNKAEYWNGDIPWINSGKVNEFRIIEPSEFINDEGLAKSATTLLPSKTTVLAITGATLGQVSLLEISSCTNQSVVGILENKLLPYEFIYPMIRNKIQDIISYQTGGAQQHINKGNVENSKFILPVKETIHDYKLLVSELYKLIANNCFENSILKKIRDSLLTKLMSGEIRVPVKEVV